MSADGNSPPTQITPAERKSWAANAASYLWGTVQGAWNEKQSTSQIIIDAAIGMIPLVGDATAARDLVAVSSRLANHEEKRREATEWVLLVVLLFALIPVIGGVIKGVGRVLITTGKTAAEVEPLLADLIKVVNRLCHGNAVAWLRQLDLLKYERQLIEKFGQFIDTLTRAMDVIGTGLSWVVSDEIKAMAAYWSRNLKALRQLGGEMIPQALKDLNARLKSVQKALYQAEWHTLTTGTQATTREVEARVVDYYAARELPGKPGKYPQNPSLIEDTEGLASVYERKDGWPDLTTSRHLERLPSSVDELFSSAVSTFSGPLKATSRTGPRTMSRVIGIGTKDSVKGTFPAGAFWIDSASIPKTAREWREKYAVVNEWNHNGYVVFVDIPAGKTLHTWEGTAAEQWSKDGKQYFAGGGVQDYVDFTLSGVSREEGAAMKKAFEHGASSFTTKEGFVFRVEPTNWPDANARLGFTLDDAAAESRVQALSEAEYAAKRGHSAGSATATRIHTAIQNQSNDETP